MDKPLQLKNSDSEEVYLPSAEAGKELGYTPDHVARLCRQGELSCVRIGNRWQVEVQSLNAYLKRSREQAEELQKQLSVARRAEYEEKSQFVSSQEAARLSGYSQDHIARLCRDGELSCTQEGTKWRVRRDSLFQYQADLKKTNEERNQKLSEERKQTYKELTRRGARILHTLPQSVVAGVSVALLFVFISTMQSGGPLKQVVEQASPKSQLALLWPLQFAIDPISDFIVEEFFFYTPPPLLGGSKTPPATTAPSTVVNNVTNNKITNNTFNVSGVSETQLNSQLSDLEKRIIALIPKNIPYSGPSRSTPVRTETFAQAQRIDQLSGVAISGGTISGAAISGGSLSGVAIPAGLITGVLALANGGVGTSTVPTQDQVLIGNGTGYDLKTLTAGSNVTISTTSNSIVISSTGGSGSSFGQSFELVSGALAPTTTVGVIVSASSTITALSSTYGTTTNATSTNLFASNFTLGSLTGLLRATAGSIATATIDLVNDVGSSILAVANGGTGWANLQANTLLLGNGTSRVATTSAGVNGQILSLVSGVPSWVATTTFSSGLTYSAGNVTNTGVLSLAHTFGSAQTGTLTLATSTATAFNGLTISNAITNSGGTFTFAPNTISGTLDNTGLTNSTVSYGGISVALGGSDATPAFNLIDATGLPIVGGTTGTLTATRGGTGLSTIASSSLLIGGAGNTWLQFATSSLGIALADTTGTLPEIRGGTNQTSYTTGDILYASGANTLSRLAAGTGGFVLAMANGVPAWVASTTLTTISGTLDLATQVGSSILAVANGGTGWANLQANTLLLGNGTGRVATTSAGTNGQILSLVSGVPSWVATTTFSSGLTYSAGNVTNTGVLSNIAGAGIAVSGATGNVTISQTDQYRIATTSGLSTSQLSYFTQAGGVTTLGGVATTSLTLSGAFSHSGTLGALVGGSAGTLSLATNGVALTNLAQIPANSVLGNATGATGNVTALATSSLGITFSSLVGTASDAQVDNNLTISGGTIENTPIGAVTPSTGVFTNATSTNATTTNLAVSGQTRFSSLSLGGLAVNALGQVYSAATSTLATISGALDLATQVGSSILAVANGGTGWANLQANTLLLGNGTGRVATTSSGVNGQILSLVSGVPSWVATTTFSSGLTYSAGNVTNTGVLSLAHTFGSAQTGTLTVATSSSATSNGVTVGQTITNSGGVFTFTPTVSVSGIPNSALQNSTISGVALGSTLAALSATNGTLTFSGSYDGSTARTVGLNLGNANTWTALQQFNAHASTTQLSVSGPAYFANAQNLNWRNSGNTADTAILTLSGDTTILRGGGGTPTLQFQNTSGTPLATFLEGGNIGIGTTSPWAKLAINPVAGDTNQFVVGSSTATSFLINSAGNVGIGTTSPTERLHIEAASARARVWSTLNGANAGYRAAAFSSNGTARFGGYYFVAGDTTATTFLGLSADDNNFNFVVNQNGNVGVGSTSPYAKLSVSASAGQTSPLFQIASSSVATTFLTVAADGFGTTTLSGLNIAGSATSTSNVGFNITTGCFAINGTCVGGGSGSPGGSDGQLQYNNGGSFGGASSVYYDDVNNLLGIGTTSPWAKLAVNPVAGDTNQFVVGSSTATSFIINNAGNVGVGTTTPSRSLEVHSTGNTYVRSTALTTSNDTAFELVQGSNYAASGFLTATGCGTGWTIYNGGCRVSVLSSGNVGIGTTTPFAKLAVNPVAGDTNQFVVGSSTATSFLINSAGNVGVGTTNPGTKLHVSGDLLLDDGTTAGDTLTFDDDFADPVTAPNKIVLHSSGYGFGVSTSDLDIHTDANVRFYEDVSGTPTERFTISSGGNVGIGETTPGNKLTVNTDGQSNANISARAGNSNSFEWGHSNTAGFGSTLGFQAGNGVAFLAFSAEAGTNNNTYRTRGVAGAILRSDNAGGFTFSTAGTATADNQTPTDLVSIVTGGGVGINDTSPTEGKLTVGGDLYVLTNTASGADPLCWDGAGGSLHADCTSLAKWKTNVTDYEAGLDEILALTPRLFDWKRNEDGTLSDSNQYDRLEADVGFIAEEVSSVDYNFGRYDKETGELRDVHERGVLGGLVNAVQELYAMILTNADKIAAFSERLMTREIHISNQLCLGETCITEIELKEILALRGQQMTSGNVPVPDATTVTVDTEAPVITIYGNNPALVAVGATYVDLGASVSDTIDQNLGIRTYVDGIQVSTVVLDTSTSTSYTITYRAVDNDGNASEAQRIVMVGDSVETNGDTIVINNITETSITTTTVNGESISSEIVSATSTSPIAVETVEDQATVVAPLGDTPEEEPVNPFDIPISE